MEQKPGWTYTYKSSLMQYIAVNDKTNIMYTEDKTMYTAQESALLSQIDYELPLCVHLVKKMFGGTVLCVK